MEQFEKFAIVYRWAIKENSGGPSGYLANLRRGLETKGYQINIYSLPNLMTSSGDKRTTWRNKFIKKIKDSKMLQSPFLIYFELKSIWEYLYSFNWENKVVFERAADKEIIQFENVEDLFDFKKKLKYKGITILTPHRPEPLHIEKINELKSHFNTSYPFGLLKYALRHIERKAYTYADSFIFPSEEAMNLYNEFPGFKEASKGKLMKYVFTGTPIKEPTISAGEYRKKIGIKEKETFIAFIGRHNEVKGYDLVIEAFSDFDEGNIKVVCAGPPSSINYPNSENWIELGKIDDPYNLISSADLVVLPNRSTYFDLIAVETLAQGKILVASSTGGNISLSKYSKGVVLFKSEDKNDFVNKVNHALALAKEERKIYEQDNLNLFKRFCTLEKFSENYLRAVFEIMELKRKR